jgi:23S rRNA G2445 N2-methylase RlmL
LSKSPSYSPHLILYICRNSARLLLKLNNEPMHKFGWKKNIGWGSMRETLAASILYKTGLLAQAQLTAKLKLWDPFCGSATIPLVALSIAKSLRVRQ